MLYLLRDFMINNLSILIPARGGSKRIKNKNIVEVGGRPLMAYCITEALKITSNVYVSTDNHKIRSVALNYGAKVIKRPSALATDTSTTNSVITHFLKEIDVDCFACVQPTSPLLKAEYLLQGFKKIKDMDYNSIISVYEDKQFCWSKDGKPMNFELGNRKRTQDIPSWYVENGAFYITTKNDFSVDNKLVNGKVGFVQMPKINSVDIDGLPIAKA